MANEVQKFNGQLPAASARSRARVAEVNKRFTEGVGVSFPRISIKGKTFTFKSGATIYPFLRDGMAIPLEVVLVTASEALSKTYYVKQFSDGTDAPDCWSNDSVKPDRSIPNPVNPTCGKCPKNEMGTARTTDGLGGKGKACQDNRRVVLSFVDDLMQDKIGPILLRMSWTSNTNLVSYLDFIGKQGFAANSCVTRMLFDTTLAYPKLKFEFVRPLTDEEEDRAIALETDTRTERMLDAPPEGDEPSASREEDDDSRYDAPASPNAPVTPGVNPGVSPEVVAAAASIPAETAAKPAEKAAEPVSQSAPVQTPGISERVSAGISAGTIVDLKDGRYVDMTAREFIDAQGNPLEKKAEPTRVDPASTEGIVPHRTKPTRKTTAKVAEPVAAPAPAPAPTPAPQPQAAAATGLPADIVMPSPPPSPVLPMNGGNGPAQPAGEDLESVLAGFMQR